ncbi:MAG TPA: hypothetical protein VFW96_21115 [Thermomicrobiales bacterium]|nr:hypothetical protein [Thermomicrobiales bacterium]
MRAAATGREDAGAPPLPGRALLGRRWVVGALIAAAYVAATVLMTWPYAAHLWSETPPGGDPLLQIWIARWVQHALITNPLHLYDANALYPLPDTLAYSDSNVPAALLAAPFYLLTHNGIFANNLLVLGTFVLAAGGMCALVAHLTGNRAAGFLAGLGYAFLPYRYAHLWHLNQLSHAWTPWVLFAFVLLVERRTWRPALAFGLLLAVQVLASFYVAFQIALAVGVAFAVAVAADKRARTGRFAAHFAAACGLAAVLVLPFALPYLQVRDQQGLERTLLEAEKWQATPDSYLKVEARNRVWEGLTAAHGGEDTLFPGGLALLGAVVGLAGLAGTRRRRAPTLALLAIAAVAFVMSLGPTWDAEHGGTTPLPYRFIFDHVPLFKAMRVTARFGVLVDFAVVALAGLGAAWAWERLGPRLAPGRARLAAGAATAVLAALVLIELNTTPVPLTPVDRSPNVVAPYHWLAAQPDQGPVMEFPATTDDRIEALAMYRSTTYWKPLVNGYSGFVPRAHGELTDAFTHDLKRPDGSVAHGVSYVDAANVGLLQDLGVRYLVVHQYGYKREDWPTVVAQLEGTGQVEQVGDFGEATIYRVRPASAPRPTVAVDLYAPALAVHNVYWQPVLVVQNPSRRDAFISPDPFKPLTMTVTWRDDGGHVARRDTIDVMLPAVVPPGATVLQLQPDQPAAPGRYTVQLDVASALDLHRTLTVDVAATPPAGAADGPPIAFASAALAGASLRPGETANLTLSWEARRKSPEDYTIFAQLIGPDGKVWGQSDAPAGWPSHHTSTWQPGERVALAWPVPLKPDAPPGRYRLLIGMYRHTPTGIERVPVRWPSGDATEYWAGEIEVK